MYYILQLYWPYVIFYLHYRDSLNIFRSSNFRNSSNSVQVQVMIFNNTNTIPYDNYKCLRLHKRYHECVRKGEHWTRSQHFHTYIQLHINCKVKKKNDWSKSVFYFSIPNVKLLIPITWISIFWIRLNYVYQIDLVLIC